VNTSSYIGGLGSGSETFAPFTLNFKYYPNSQNSSRNRIRISSFTATGSGNGLNNWQFFYPFILSCSKPRSAQCPPDSGLCISCTATAYYDSVNKKINISIGTTIFTFEST
jgi:hypothetical protein